MIIRSSQKVIKSHFSFFFQNLIQIYTAPPEILEVQYCIYTLDIHCYVFWQMISLECCWFHKGLLYTGHY